MLNQEVQLFHGRPIRTPLSNFDILYHTQNELVSDIIQTEANLPTRDPGVGDYDSSTSTDFSHQYLSCKYDGILLRHDLEPRIKQARELLRRLKHDYNKEENGEKEVVDEEETARKEFRKQLSFIYDTFDRLETARRAAASQLLAEKQNFRQTKDTFLRTRTYLLDSVAQDIHEATIGFTHDFKELQKHRHFLEKKLEATEPKVDRAEKINGVLHHQVRNARQLCPKVHKRVQEEEGDLSAMREKHMLLKRRLKELKRRKTDSSTESLRARRRVHHERTELFDELQDKLGFLNSSRDERLNRLYDMKVNQEKRDLLSEKLRELQNRFLALQSTVGDLHTTIGENTAQLTEKVGLIKQEHLRRETIRQEMLAAGKPLPTREEVRQKLRLQNTRCLRKIQQRIVKEEKKKQATVREEERLTDDVETVTQRLLVLRQTKESLLPRIERIQFLEETFQHDLKEKKSEKENIVSEHEVKKEQSQQAKKRLTATKKNFKLKLEAKTYEMERVKAKRATAEKFLTKLRVQDKVERKHIQQTVGVKKVTLQQATDTHRTRLTEFKKVEKKSEKVKAELEEVELAVTVEKELIEADLEIRTSQEEELTERSHAAVAEFRERQSEIKDKKVEIAHLKEQEVVLRDNLEKTLAELKQKLLVELPKVKMDFHVEYSAYQMLRWHQKRFSELKDNLHTRGDHERAVEIRRVEELYDRAVLERKELGDACTKNFREVRKYYHVNVVHRIMHIESVRKTLNEQAIEERHTRALELVEAEKHYEKEEAMSMRDEEQHWNVRVQYHKTNVRDELRFAISTEDEILQRSATIWESLKTDVVAKQKMQLPGFLNIFRRTFESTGYEDGAGSAARWHPV